MLLLTYHLLTSGTHHTVFMNTEGLLFSLFFNFFIIFTYIHKLLVPMSFIVFKFFIIFNFFVIFTYIV